MEIEDVLAVIADDFDSNSGSIVLISSTNPFAIRKISQRGCCHENHASSPQKLGAREREQKKKLTPEAGILSKLSKKPGEHAIGSWKGPPYA